MKITIQLDISRKDMKQAGLIFGDLFGSFLDSFLNGFPQPSPKQPTALDKNLLVAIAEAFDVTNTDNPEGSFDENYIVRNIQILKKDNELFKDVSNVVLMFHMMALGFERECISSAGEPPRYGYQISPSKDLLIALEEDSEIAPSPKFATDEDIKVAFGKVFKFDKEGKVHGTYSIKANLQRYIRNKMHLDIADEKRFDEIVITHLNVNSPENCYHEKTNGWLLTKI